MRITAADIEGMASPGWECGVDLDVDFGGEVLGDEDYSEINFAATKGRADEAAPAPEETETIKKVAYSADGRREGLSTLEICTRLKNEKMTGENRREQEFLAILQTYPRNGADFKVLMWLAHGFSCRQAGERLQRSEKTIRNAARRLRQFRDHGTVKLVEKTWEGKELLKPFPPSRAGRPRGGKAAEIIQLDLLGDPIPPYKPRKARKGGARRPRVCPPVPGQLSLFDMAA